MGFFSVNPRDPLAIHPGDQELTLRVTKSRHLFVKPHGYYPLDPPRSCLFFFEAERSPFQDFWRKSSGPCIRPPFNIKAPLRAKDFEKIGVAWTSYRSPALGGAGRKFPGSGTAFFLSPPFQDPLGLKDQTCHSRPAPGSWRGTEGPHPVIGEGGRHDPGTLLGFLICRG